MHTYLSVSYDMIKQFISVYQNKDMFKNKIVFYFWGFSKYNNNEEIEITARGMYSHQPINVFYHQQLLMNKDGGGFQMSICPLRNLRKLRFLFYFDYHIPSGGAPRLEASRREVHLGSWLRTGIARHPVGRCISVHIY